MIVICNGDDELLDGKPGKLKSGHSTGCGRRIDIGDGEPWDVKTEPVAHVLGLPDRDFVTSRHRQVYCDPGCGTSTWVREDYPGQSEQADAERRGVSPPSPASPPADQEAEARRAQERKDRLIAEGVIGPDDGSE